MLDKNANTRLGSPTSPNGELHENAFFHEIDWKKLERRQLESPFKLEIVRKTFSHITERKKNEKQPTTTTIVKAKAHLFFVIFRSFVIFFALFGRTCFLSRKKKCFLSVFQKHPIDTRHFDRAYTREKVRLPSTQRGKIRPKDQEQFKKFSYTNPNITTT